MSPKRLVCGSLLALLHAYHFSPLPAQAQDPATCQAQRSQHAHSRWDLLNPLLTNLPSAPPVTAATLTLVSEQLQAARTNPRLAQIAIDTLTQLAFDPLVPYTTGLDPLKRPQTLLILIERTPPDLRSRLQPLVQQFASVAQSLPPGYQASQSRGLITAALADHRLTAAPSAQARQWLQQAEQQIPQIQAHGIKGETQMRLAVAWKLQGRSDLMLATLNRSFATLREYAREDNASWSNVLIDGYLDQRQFTSAIAATQQLPGAIDPLTQRFRIAAAYQRAGQGKQAQQLFETTFSQLFRAERIGNFKDVAALEGIHAFAQAGGLASAIKATQQLPQMTTPQSYRAQLWLAIAGQARRQNQPQLANQAMQQLIAVGRLGEIQAFPVNTGRDRDFGWGQPMIDLSKAHGYEPEMIKFIEHFKLQAATAEFLISEALKAKQFDVARQRVPQPMPRWDKFGGPTDARLTWLVQVAIAAAKAGQPTHLTALAQQQAQTLQASHLKTDATVLPLLSLLDALHEVGQRDAARTLVTAWVTQVRSLPVEGNTQLRLGQLELALLKHGYSAEANQLRQDLVGQLRSLNTPSEQVRGLLDSVDPEQLSEPALTRVRAIAEQLGLQQGQQMVDGMITYAMQAKQLQIAGFWVMQGDQISGPPPGSGAPPEDVVAQQIERRWLVAMAWQRQGQPQQVKVWLDRALALLPKVAAEKNAMGEISLKLMHGYLQLNQVAKAEEAIRLVSGAQYRSSYLQSLACFK